MWFPHFILNMWPKCIRATRCGLSPPAVAVLFPDFEAGSWFCKGCGVILLRNHQTVHVPREMFFNVCSRSPYLLGGRLGFSALIASTRIFQAACQCERALGHGIFRIRWLAYRVKTCSLRDDQRALLTHTFSSPPTSRTLFPRFRISVDSTGLKRSQPQPYCCPCVRGYSCDSGVKCPGGTMNTKGVFEAMSPSALQTGSVSAPQRIS